MDMVLEECAMLADDQVVARVLAGESMLYELLMRRYNQRVYRVIRSVLTDDTEAEDVLQEAWVRAYEHLDQFKGMASFSTWVTKIAFYEALARARKKARWTPLEDPEGEIMADAERHRSNAETPEAQAIRAEIGQVLQAAVDALPDSYRSVFVLRAVECLSTVETAQCLGLSEEAVKTRLHRSRALLRRELETRADLAITEAYSFLGARCDRAVARVLERLQILPAKQGLSGCPQPRS
jgi:RNA polymerase sigma-70 factor (ECF subfamily)